MSDCATVKVRTVALACGGLSDYLELMKVRLVGLVLFTTGIGFVCGYPGRLGLPAALMLLNTLLGTALVACGSMALNQVIERESDAAMYRTRHRPVPQGRIGVTEAWVCGVLISAIGTLYLLGTVNPPAAGLALLTSLTYLVLYTPLKKVTTLNTVVGAVSGGIPPMIGYAAAAGRLDAAAWVLFGILFVWQIPHFLGIAWMHRDDYARAGYVMLPVVDRSGRATSRQVLLFSLTLLLVSLMPTVAGIAGMLYFAVAFILGMLFIGCSFPLLTQRDTKSARQVFIASVIYLPILLTTLMLDQP